MDKIKKLFDNAKVIIYNNMNLMFAGMWWGLAIAFLIDGDSDVFVAACVINSCVFSCAHEIVKTVKGER